MAESVSEWITIMVGRGTRLETTQWPERLWFNDGLLLDCTSLGFRLGQIDLLGHANTERELE